VYASSNEDYLGDIDQSRQESLRIAMHLDRDQFYNSTLSLRTLANNTLDSNLPWNDQDEDIRASFLAEVEEQYPIFCSRYEDGWPIQVYMRRFLENKARRFQASTRVKVFTTQRFRTMTHVVKRAKLYPETTKYRPPTRLFVFRI